MTRLPGYGLRDRQSPGRKCVSNYGTPPNAGAPGSRAASAGCGYEYERERYSWKISPYYFAPAPAVLPAFLRSTSPVYRTPLFLYGSGGRNERMLAATCPTICLS